MNTKVTFKGQKAIQRDQRIAVYCRDWGHIFLGLSGYPSGQWVYAWATEGFDSRWQLVWICIILQAASVLFFSFSTAAKQRLIRRPSYDAMAEYVVGSEEVSDEH